MSLSCFLSMSVYLTASCPGGIRGDLDLVPSFNLGEELGGGLSCELWKPTLDEHQLCLLYCKCAFGVKLHGCGA